MPVRIFVPLFLCLFFGQFVIAQQKDSTLPLPAADTLDNVTVTAFNLQSRWQDAPAAVAVLDQRQLQLVGNTSLVAGINVVPGVRMEERSPGSYRLSVRGSLLRSPFGVRNVKVYWNDMPLTDAGGNTYLQLIDVNQLQSLEVIKGPASSLYGANTGGAVILHSGQYAMPKKNTYQVAISGGSYGLFNEQASWTHSTARFATRIQQTHINSSGYREQSALRRDALKWDGTWNINARQKLAFLATYTDLFYETPGGITLEQMQANPKQARQPTPVLPGAVTQQTSVRNKTALAGISLTSAFSPVADNTTTLTASYTHFANPFITNYEKRYEWNYGGRTTFRLHNNDARHQLQWLAGAEWQQNKADRANYGNNKGVPDTLQFREDIQATQYFLFTQLTATLANRWVIQAGASTNKQAYRYKKRDDPVYSQFAKTNQKSLLTPRLSLLYKTGNNTSLYGVAARGFSPPSIAEIKPSDNNYYPNLQAEYGWNYEGGWKGAVAGNRLFFDLSYYYFHLKNAIIRQSNDAGQEYFVNAGSTVQQGVEVWVKGLLIKNEARRVSLLSLSNSLSYQPYRFDHYVSGTADSSGNRLTGVPRAINITTASIQTKSGAYANVIYNYTSRIPLNDANSVFADGYHLLQAKLGYTVRANRGQYHFFVGGDNLLNETYSLGNDINAFGKRYFNPAPKRNYFAGVQVTF